MAANSDHHPPSPAGSAYKLYIWSVPADTTVDAVRYQLSKSGNEPDRSSPSSSASTAIKLRSTSDDDDEDGGLDVVWQCGSSAEWLRRYRSVIWLRDRPYRWQVHGRFEAAERRREREWQRDQLQCRQKATRVLSFA